MYMPNLINPLEILDRWSTPDGTTIGTHYCWDRKLSVSGPSAGTINTAIPYTATYKDWQNVSLASENRQVTIKITGPAQPSTLILTPVNGQANFNLNFPVTGTFKIHAEAVFAECDFAEMEVVIS